MMTKADKLILAIAFALAFLSFVLGWLLGYERSHKSVLRSAVAPEVCKHNGSVVQVTLDGSIYYVRCSDGMYALVQR